MGQDCPSVLLYIMHSNNKAQAERTDQIEFCNYDIIRVRVGLG